jgi:lysozyme family protein
MDFRNAVRIVLELEGGDRLVDHPKDPGGLTKYGISLRAYPKLGRNGIMRLTEADAIAIYRCDYWDRLGIDRLPDRLKLPVFDGAVNHGQKTATKLLQRSLRELGANVHVDGEFGPRTTASANAQNEKRLLVTFLLRRQQLYRSLEGYNVFGFGWEKRIMEVAISA